MKQWDMWSNLCHKNISKQSHTLAPYRMFVRVHISLKLWSGGGRRAGRVRTPIGRLTETLATTACSSARLGVGSADAAVHTPVAWRLRRTDRGYRTTRRPSSQRKWAARPWSVALRLKNNTSVIFNNNLGGCHKISFKIKLKIKTILRRVFLILNE